MAIMSVFVRDSLSRWEVVDISSTFFIYVPRSEQWMDSQQVLAVTALAI